ncbi:MAG: OmpH family outer membrane protein [Pararhodobacter sp.]|nr:OmpH family outer membrane protein [Pararhodobacter sp.]
MRSRLWPGLLAGALFCAPVLALPSMALSQPAPLQMPYRILDPDRLLQGSRLGQQILAANREAEQALDAENAAIAAQLVAEERALTDLRASLSPEEFRIRADAFDTRVEEIRAERNQRSEELARRNEAEVQRFFAAVLPVLDRLMAEDGIVGLFRPETLILWSERLDITDQAIARLDADFAAQSQPQPQSPAPPPAPPETPQTQP